MGTRGRRIRESAPIAAAAAGCLLLVAAGPAEPDGPEPQTDGDCIAVGAYYRVGSGEDTYVIGPEHCVRDTHWSTLFERSVSVGPESGPAEVGVSVSIPAP